MQDQLRSREGRIVRTVVWGEPWASYSLVADYEPSTGKLISTVEVFHRKWLPVARAISLYTLVFLVAFECWKRVRVGFLRSRER